MISTTTLVIGFDSAWTAHKSGAIVAIRTCVDGRCIELGEPEVVNFLEADTLIRAWQEQWKPERTFVLIDQPTVVHNSMGQRAVEHIVSSAVSRRKGGMQPANTGRVGMFCANAPIWSFLCNFGGAADPFTPVCGTAVYETYPVLAMIALGWTIEGRLPKYNPDRKKTFSLRDWKHVSKMAEEAFRRGALMRIADWLRTIGETPAPRKAEQDRLDACICLLVGLHIVQGGDCLMVGNVQTGFIVVPRSAALHAELDARCYATGRQPSEWVRIIRNPDRP